MVSLGGFSFEVRADTAQAEAAFARLRQAAAQTAQSVSSGLSGGGPSSNFSAQQAGLQQLNLITQQVTNNFILLGQAAAKVKIPAQPAQQLGQLERLFASGAGVAGFASATVVASEALARLGAATSAAVQGGVQYNSSLQQLNNSFIQYTGSAEKAAAAIANLRELGQRSPFQTADVLAAGQTFIRVTQGDIGRMQQLVTLTTALAAAKPELGFQGASQAIEQLISGDYRAFEDRTNIAFGTVREMAAQGASGMDLYTKAVERAGGSIQLLNRNAETFTARLTTFQSSLRELNAIALKPIFEDESSELAKANAYIAQHNQALREEAGLAGEVARGFVEGAAAQLLQQTGLQQLINLSQAYVAIRERVSPPQAAASTAAPPPTERQQAAQDLEDSKNRLAQIEIALTKNQEAAKRVNDEFAAARRPLQDQLQALQAINYVLERQQAASALTQARLSEQVREAQAPANVRADVAGSNAELDRQQRILDIRVKRGQLVEGIAALEMAASNRVAEVQIRGQERAVQALQREQQVRAQARQDALEAIREQQIAEAQARQDALDGLRDQIRVRREAASDAIEAVRDEQRAREQAYQDALRGTERVHQAQQEAARDAIEALQEQARAADRAAQEALRNSAAQRALTRLDESERRRGQAQSLAAAERAVREARTFSGRRDAQERLEEVKHQISVENRRIALEKKIAAEKEAADKASEARQDAIRAAESKQRQEDREYQRTRDAQADAHRVAVEAQDAANREADKAERAAQRAEDVQVRDQERADRAADRAAAETIRQQEKADRLAERADQATLQGAQDRLQAARDHLADVQRAAQAAADAVHLQNLRDQKVIDDARLDNDQKILDAENGAQLVAAARAKALADDTAARLDNTGKIEAAEIRIASLDTVERIAALEAAERLRLAPILAAKEAREAEQRAVEAINTALQARLNNPALQNAGQGTGEPPSRGNIPQVDLGGFFKLPDIGALFTSVVDGLSNFFANDTRTPAIFQTWVNDDILGVITGPEGLDAQSPSKKLYAIGGDAAEGFINGFSAKEDAVKAAMESPFDYELTTYLPAFIRSFGTDAGTAAQSFIGNFAAAHIEDALGAPFDTFSSAYVPLYERNFGVYAANIAQAMITGFNSRDLLGALEDPFKRFINVDSPLLDAQLKIEGQYAADGFIDGWNERMADRKLEIVYRDTGGNGGGGLDLGSPIGSPPATGPILPSQYDRSLIGLGSRTTGGPAAARPINFNPTLIVNAPGASAAEVKDIVYDGLEQFAHELANSADLLGPAPPVDLAVAG